MQGFILFPHSSLLLEEVLYVDDTCTALLQDWWNPSTCAHLNSIDSNIQFTVESESEGKVPFLDVLRKRKEEDGSISTLVFCKATHMDQYLAYECMLYVAILLFFNPYPFFWTVCLLHIFRHLVIPTFCTSP